MNISRFPTYSRRAFSATILTSFPLLFSASSNRAQTNSNSPGGYAVSVQELRMAGKGRAAFDKGSHMLEKGDAAKSIAYLEQAIAQYPEHYWAYYDLGVAHLRLAHHAEAEQAFQKAIDLTKGNFALPQFGLAAVLCQKAEYAQAEALLRRALAVEPGSAVGKYYLAWAQFGLNRLSEAEQALEQALVRDANFAEAYSLLAKVHLRQKNLVAALRDLESYLKLEPHKEQARSLAEQIRQEMQQDAGVVAAARP